MVSRALQELSDELVAVAGLPQVVEATPLTGRGFENTIVVLTFADRSKAVLRAFREPRMPETPRAVFLAQQGVPAPALLAANDRASLVEFAEGAPLGDHIENRTDTEQVWRLVGAAYARVHAVSFPTGLAGEDLGPARFVLTPRDPAAELHEIVDESVPGLRRLAPDLVPLLGELHLAIDAVAPSLREARSALGHGDINMWNVLVSQDRATLIDWDFPRVGDPAKEVALLDKHASLYNGTGLPPAFFAGYGKTQEPNTTLHRVVQTLGWATSGDFTQIDRDPDLTEDLKQRAKNWLPKLVAHVREMPAHLERLRALSSR
ncbi:phosphotransferase enzyme family protein [Actinokineospora iranica]|uniref:phosphotransferase enzyme family protein n=1 Tax=Actinokineospora iranica TaxID=1271860 RepID=UPI00158723E9|nr:phosphotransferase [Actinokineospora iranica]